MTSFIIFSSKKYQYGLIGDVNPINEIPSRETMAFAADIRRHFLLVQFLTQRKGLPIDYFLVVLKAKTKQQHG